LLAGETCNVMQLYTKTGLSAKKKPAFFNVFNDNTTTKKPNATLNPQKASIGYFALPHSQEQVPPSPFLAYHRPSLYNPA
jgi:hypothetical protein